MVLAVEGRGPQTTGVFRPFFRVNQKANEEGLLRQEALGFAEYGLGG